MSANAVRACGIDPGSRTWAVALTSNAELEEYAEIPTKKIIETPREIVEIINSFGEVEAVSAPSGYGLPLKKISELSERDFELITLKKKEERGQGAVGVESVLREMKKERVNAFVLPGVKHLPTVPDYRKINKIDLGTPDKVCACAAAMELFCEKNECDYEGASFLFAEIGSAFNAFLAVDGGRIVDGIGGSCASMGRRARGKVDAELAYTMKEKNDVFSGGLEDAEKACSDAFEAFIEGILKDLNMLRASVDCKKVVLSCRDASELKMKLELRGSEFEFEELKFGDGKMKPAAVGAALVADGLAGGKKKELIEALKIKESSGSVFDFVAP